MSGLAGILQARGNSISGSDTAASALLHEMTKNGMHISSGHTSKNIPSGTELVIHSLAIPNSNPELREARRRKTRILSYPEAVGELTQQYLTIAICGTHGKSTITSLIAKTLLEHQFDPTILVGTNLKELGGKNFRVGKSRIFILEACEYRRAFLHYSPRIILLHTLDPDHLDYYKDFNDYLLAFEQFVSKLPPDGYFFGNLDDDDVHNVYKTLQLKKFPSHNIFTYATKYPASDFFLQGQKIIERNSRAGELNLKIPGFHNRTNALAAFAVARTLGITPRDILQSLNQYSGASRRFEEKGHVGKTIIIDDYAHHPAEISATLQAARERFPKEKICVVFQPHQYSRTKNLLKEFAACFQGADSVIIPNIYEVRDSAEDKRSVSPEKLVTEIKKFTRSARFGGGLEKTASFLKTNAKQFDVIITMGAGDVWKIADLLTHASPRA